MSRKRVLTLLVTAAVVGLVGYYFHRAFMANWASLSRQSLHVSWLQLGISFVAIIGAALLGTVAWQASVNELAGRRSFDFAQSFATVNASGLTKYLPGKVWSYALQMYWLSSAGLQKSLVIYINLLNLGLSLLMSGLTGLALLAISATGQKFGILGACAAALLVGDLLFIKYHGWALAQATRLGGKLLRREINYFEVPGSLLFKLHAVHFASAALSAISTFIAARAIGFPVPLAQFPLISASYLLADVVGFLALIVPGGIGVREGVMYFLLGGADFGPLAVVLPLVIRALGMASDVMLGALALFLLRRMTPQPTAPSPSA